jgi:hypothetical protein
MDGTRFAEGDGHNRPVHIHAHAAGAVTAFRDRAASGTDVTGFHKYTSRFKFLTAKNAKNTEKSEHRTSNIEHPTLKFKQ